MKNVIEHCGKRIPTEKIYVSVNYPYPGDMTVIYSASCCPKNGEPHSAYAYFIRPLVGECGELQQADRHRRQKFDSLIKLGLAKEFKREDQEGRPTRGQPIVSEYTKQICLPAEANIFLFRITKNAETTASF